MKIEKMPGWTGPVCTLPGKRFNADPDQGPCEACGKNNPEFIVQGETDSFGCEYVLLCGDCADKDEDSSGEGYFCDTCKKESEKTYPCRDPDEGMSGPVYWLCSACRRKVSQSTFNGDDF